MIVIDTSAVVALLTGESDEAVYREAIKSVEHCHISAFTVFESRVVLNAKGGEDLVMAFDLLLAEAGISVHAFDADQARLAFQVYQYFGKGSGHDAGLNLGDCAAYTLAKSLDAPLLFKGADFARTDVRPAV